MSKVLLFRQPDSSGRVIRATVEGELPLLNTGSREWFEGMFPGLHLEYGHQCEIEVRQLEPGVWGWSYTGGSKRRIPGHAGQVNTRSARGGFGKVIKASVEEHKKGGVR